MIWLIKGGHQKKSWKIQNSKLVNFQLKKINKICSKWPRNQFKTIQFFHLLGGGGLDGGTLWDPNQDPPELSLLGDVGEGWLGLGRCKKWHILAQDLFQSKIFKKSIFGHLRWKKFLFLESLQESFKALKFLFFFSNLGGWVGGSGPGWNFPTFFFFLKTSLRKKMKCYTTERNFYSFICIMVCV